MPIGGRREIARRVIHRKRSLFIWVVAGVTRAQRHLPDRMTRGLSRTACCSGFRVMLDVKFGFDRQNHVVLIGLRVHRRD